MLSRRKRPSSNQQQTVPPFQQIRRAVVGSGLAYAGATLGYALLRPLLGERSGWIELVDDLEPWAYVTTPALGLLAATLRSRELAGAAGGLAAGFGLRWGYRYLRRNPEPRQATADLKVMTFNTLAWQREGHDIAASIEDANPDLIGLQEIGPNAARYLATRFADRYPHHYETPSASPSGAGVLSRYPLVDPVAFRASDGGHWWQRMVVDAPMGKITFFNIHTKIPHLRSTHRLFGGLRVPLAFHTERRNSEVRRLVAMLDRVTGPVIMTGDFNMTEHSADHRLIAQRVRDAFKAVGTGLGHSFPRCGTFPRLFPAPFPMLRLDYVWHSEHFAPAWAYRGQPGHSDHHPIVAGLRWTAGEGQADGSIPLAAATV